MNRWNGRVWPGDGGCVFPTDPKDEPRHAPALWSPDDAPDVIIVETADSIEAIPLPLRFQPLVEVATGAERRVVVAHGAARLRLCVRHTPDRLVPAFSIPCDPQSSLRVAAVARLQRVTRCEPMAADRSAHPTVYQRARCVQLLSIHDALDAGHSSRDLAFGLVFPNHSPLAGAVWKGSSERRHVLRLIAEARSLIASGH